MKKCQIENTSEISEKLFRILLFRVFDFALQAKPKTGI